MNMKLAALGAALTLFALAAGAAAQETVNFDAANAPFMYAKDGKAAGVYPALIGEAFKRMGVKLAMGAVPWKRALEETDSGKAGTGGIYFNSERQKKYDFSEPFYEERLGVFVLAGKEFKFDSFADLAGKSFNVMAGWSYGDEFDGAVKAGTIKTDGGANNDVSNMQKLANGRNDATISVVEAGLAAIKALKLEGKVVMLPKLLVVNKVYLAFGKSAKKTGLLADFNKAMAAMRADGSFQKLVDASFAGN